MNIYATVIKNNDHRSKHAGEQEAINKIQGQEGNHKSSERHCVCIKRRKIGCSVGLTANLTHSKKIGYQEEGGCSEKAPSWWKISSVSI